MALINVEVNEWCRCQKWSLGCDVLIGRDMMNFCPFCGCKLMKVREAEKEVEHEEYTVPRRGIFYIARPATSDRVTEFHLVQGDASTFLCGTAKPVGATPPPDIPARNRCCRACLQALKTLPKETV